MASPVRTRVESLQPVLLSPSEDLFWRAEQHLPGAFRVAVVLRMDGCIEAGPLAEAIRRLQHRHPKLRAVVARGDDGRRRYRFDQAPPPLPFEITDCDATAIERRDVTRRLLQIDLPATGPLAAIAVLRSRSRSCSELLLTAHHGIADGLSAIMLVDDLLAEYAGAASDLDGPPRPPLPLVSAPRAGSPAGLRGRLRLGLRYLRIQREERRRRKTPLPEAPDVLPQSQWEHWVFSRDETLRLVRRCRSQRTALGGALVAAACCGLMDCLPVPEAVFKCQFPFDLRAALDASTGPVTAADLGSFASIMNAFYRVRQRPEFWDLARRAHEDVQAFERYGGPALYYNLAALMASRLFDRAGGLLMPPHNGRVTLLATSYGVVSVRDRYGSLRPRECTLIFKNDMFGPSLVMEALVLGQRLNVGFAGDRLDPAFWQRLHTAVRRHLQAAADQDATTTGASG